MKKKYIVRLTEEEREQLEQIVKTQSGSSQRVRRAWILLKSDVEGPGWTDARICEAYNCKPSTVEKLRKRLIESGFEQTLNGKESKPRSKRLDGEQEARLIALRLGKPPEGYSGWSLRLLADELVELGVVESVSHETVRTTLKKATLPAGKSNPG